MRNEFKELVIGLHGHRGAGKDAIGSALACCYMLADVACKSNMPIATTFPGLGSVRSEELDMEELYKFGQGFQKNVVIYLSEMDKFIHRRRAMSTANMVLDVLATQIGKKGITIIGTCQDWFWLDDPWIYQTDVLISCEDATRTIWGQEEGLEEGYITVADVYNISGVLPGPQYRMSQRALMQWKFPTRQTWDKRVNPHAPIFDTYGIIGVEQLMRKVVLHRTETHIGRDKASGALVKGPIEDYVPGSTALQVIQEAVNGLRDRGIQSIPGSDFRDILARAGYEGDPRQTGNYIARIPGVRVSRHSRRGVEYELTPREEEVLSGV